MAFTQAEVDAIKAALLKLVNGERIVSVALADRVVQYQQADIEQLRALLASAEAAQAGGHPYRLAAHAKGV